MSSELVDAMVEEVSSWEGVELATEPRFGGPMFQVGRRQLGHLHDAGERGAFADIPLPRAVRDRLIEEGRARPHSAMPDSGWLDRAGPHGGRSRRRCRRVQARL